MNLVTANNKLLEFLQSNRSGAKYSQIGLSVVMDKIMNFVGQVKPVQKTLLDFMHFFEVLKF